MEVETKIKYNDEIDEIVTNIYNGNIEEANEMIISVIQNLGEIIENNYKDMLNGITKYLLIAMENKDYQLVADIVYYELKKLIEEL